MQELEELERRKKEKTSFGPEENQLLYQMLENRKNDIKQETKVELENLIRERQDRQEFVNNLERSLDHNMVDQMVQAFHDEQRERKALDF